MSVYSNPIALKIQHGTTRGDVNLCSTCRHCHRARSSMTGKETMICRADYYRSVMLTEPMAECTYYSDARRPTLEMMGDIAWSLMTDKGGRKIGFLSPEELREREKGGFSSPSRVGF
jgi:hypothetical protein